MGAMFRPCGTSAGGDPAQPATASSSTIVAPRGSKCTTPASLPCAGLSAVRAMFRYRNSLSCLSGCNEGGGPTKAGKRGLQNKARLRGGTFDPVMPLSRGTTLAQEAMGMLVLVARASKHGATEGITERVAQALTLTGQVGQLARKGRDLCHFAGHLCARDDANGRS